MPNPYVKYIAAEPLREAERKGYQQALIDFGIADLIEKIGNYSDTIQCHSEPEEREALAAIFVQRLSDNLTESHVSDYFKIIRIGGDDVLANPLHIEVVPQSCNHAPNFAETITPRYSEGTRVRWVSINENREWGVIIGRFYAFAPHHYGWMWRYVVLIDSDSPSADWVAADTAWEGDLESMEDAA